MRLSAYQGEMPMDKYVRFKNEPILWDLEMNKYGLKKEEKDVLITFVGENFGIAAEQEDIMLLSMSPSISNFSIKEANGLRKAVAKKKKKLLDEVQKLFFDKGLETGTRKNMLDYVWDNYIMPQAGYGFSKNHSVPYSAIALQEMNLVHHYDPVYWNASCLTVNASADEESETSGSTNYGKIATAISKMMTRGVNIVLPEINEADFGFKPNPKDGNITFGLKGINKVGDDVARAIMDKRPYTSLENFLEKHEYAMSGLVLVNLVKAGCFDVIENKPRETIMRELVKILILLKNPPTKKLSMAHFAKVVEYGLFVEKNWTMIKRQYNFYKYVTQECFTRGNSKFKVHWLDEKALVFFKEFIEPEMELGKDYFIKEGEYHVLFTKMRRWYDKAILPFKNNFLSNDASLMRYNKENFNKLANEFWEKYCLGGSSKWEMDALSFYHGKHELADINVIKYGIVDFFKLKADPSINYTKVNKKGTYTQYHVYKLIGTVLDKDKTKRSVTLLTPTGVVLVKFYGDMFVKYNKQISRLNVDGTKTVVDKSWFSRGTKLQIIGYRRDEQFIPRVYSDNINKDIISKITGVTTTGLMEMISERPTGVEEDDDE